VSEAQDQNLDPDEKGRFDQSAALWWDTEGPMRPLHDLNPARLKYVIERCDLEGRAVLDVGCGGGILAESLAQEGARVTGIDIAEKVLEVARLHRLESGMAVDYELLTVEDKARTGNGDFDIVTCMEMLEHVPDPVSVVQGISCLLRPGGEAFFSTLNRTLFSFLLGIVAAEHLVRLCPRGTHRYDRFIRPSELSRWLRGAGMQVLDVRGIHYDPVSRSVMLGGHTRMNYLLHARRPLAPAGVSDAVDSRKAGEAA
jgi:2-polyprenyl-6-hydroxyphenyl methylase/3-demethylubiquinone-9 3-methyltransferase